MDSKYIVETVFLRTSLGIRKDRSEFTFRNSSGEYILGVSAVDGVIHISDEQNRKSDSAHTHTKIKVKPQSIRYQQIREMVVTDWLTKRTDLCNMISKK